MNAATVEWWPKLSESARSSLRSDPRQASSAELVIAITQARSVSSAWTQWEERAPSPAHLLEDEAAWIEAQGSD
ncbi:hypothetical protein ASC55_07925 [Microbacterium sp. Root322]|nr:hypothetical protein ASC55_07925 [Microbacterium sp. Root322]